MKRLNISQETLSIWRKRAKLLEELNKFVINENQLIWESYIGGNTITLNDIYGDLEEVDENEALYHEVDPEMGDISLEIKQLSVEQLKRLTTYTDDMTVFDAYENFAEREQKKIVKQYQKTKSYNDQPIVINMNTAIDGYHRIVAAILDGVGLNAVDISDFD